MNSNRAIISLILVLFVRHGALAIDRTAPFAARIAHTAKDGNVTVHADSSLDSRFAASHAAHAAQVWRYFSSVFARTPGSSVEFFYTKDQRLFETILKRYPVIVIPGGRQLTTHWEGNHHVWFIIPYTMPDFGTQLHELSHDFLYATWPRSEEHPWIKEGLGMYFESGRITEQGRFSVERPFPSYVVLFRDWQAKGALIPLRRLLTMPRDEFYRSDHTKTYSQSMMLVFYLWGKHPAMMRGVLAGFNNRTITTNAQLIDFILRSTGLSLVTLEREYIPYGTAAR